MENEVSKLAETMNQGRLVNLASGVLYPLLDKHAEEKVASICAKFAGGETNFLADIAELAYIRRLKIELESSRKRGERAFEKITKGETSGND